METATKKLYEGMFLVDSALAASDWDGVLSFIQSLLDKVGAEVISVRKWNENRLAYEINHKPRGTYILTYFRLDGQQVSVLEREVQLTEKIMRVLVLNVEHMTEEDLQKATPAEKVEKKLAETESKRTALADDKPKAEEKPEDKEPQAEKKLEEPKAVIENAPSGEDKPEPDVVSDKPEPDIVSDKPEPDVVSDKPEPVAETEERDKKEQ